MARLTIGFGIVLIILGLTGYLSAEAPRSATALIPAVAGALLAICGVLALDAAKRKHAMHAAAMVALLGFLMPAGRLIAKAAQGALPAGMALFSQIAMAVLCLIFLILCVRSFAAARRARTLGASA